MMMIMTIMIIIVAIININMIKNILILAMYYIKCENNHIFLMLQSAMYQIVI